MKITYLYHSGFLVELEQHILLFDYYKGTLPALDPNKTLLCFASHKHQDHFNFEIFDLFGQCQRTHYFLSSDIKLSDRYLERKGVNPSIKKALTCTGKHTVTSWEDVTVETLRSTDAGVAFLVSVEGKCFYHAGDLNWWHWEGETDAWNREMERAYKEEMQRLAGRHFDAAFVPLDPRLGDACILGIQVFAQYARADVIFPMHMWEEYQIVERFLKEHKEKLRGSRLVAVKTAGEEFLL